MQQLFLYLFLFSIEPIPSQSNQSLIKLHTAHAAAKPIATGAAATTTAPAVVAAKAPPAVVAVTAVIAEPAAPATTVLAAAPVAPVIPPFIPATATSSTASPISFLPLNTSTAEDTASNPAPNIAPVAPPLFIAEDIVLNVAAFPSALSAIRFVVSDEIPVDFPSFRILLFCYNDRLLSALSFFLLPPNLPYP